MNYPNAINSPTAKDLSRGTIIELAQNVYSNALYVQKLVDGLDPNKTFLNGLAQRAETAADNAEQYEADAKGYSQTAAVYAENAAAEAENAAAEADAAARSAAAAKTYLDMIIDVVLPVGTQISNRNTNFNPNTAYLGTTWRKVSGFLYGVTDLSRVDETGGEETHTLTVNEMPTHKHHVGKGKATFDYGISAGGAANNIALGPYTGAGGEIEVAEHDTKDTGGGQPHNNMPPYKATIIWERVA